MSYKTNVMRILDQHKISYRSYDYSRTGALGGEEVAAVLKENPLQVFKTLVTRSRSGACYVFVIPVVHELNLKKAAAAAGEKSIEMIKQKELLPLTGYVHGGCSPIGMKKAFPTIFHRTALDFDTILFSAGKVGYQVEVDPRELKSILNFRVEDVADE